MHQPHNPPETDQADVHDWKQQKRKRKRERQRQRELKAEIHGSRKTSESIDSAYLSNLQER